MAPLEITIWDVNHGGAAYLKTPNNRHVVVDLGDADGFSPLQTLYSRGVRQLDVAVITHPHRDHLDDIFNFSLLSPLALHMPWTLSEAAIGKGNRTSDLEYVDRYLQIRRTCTFPVVPANNLAVPSNFGGIEFQVFAPVLCDENNLNNRSLVVVASYASSKIVIPGDNEAPSWKELLNNSAFVAAVKGADVLLAAHHGREAGYCGELFEAMGKPKLVVISDGRFGDTSATSRYSAQATGWTVFDSLGTSDTRKCLTTRCDGHITIKFGWINDEPSQGPYLNVRTSQTNMSALIGRLLGGS
jgi:beta-lactamase superfamily II metal-dependent hydrolase